MGEKTKLSLSLLVNRQRTSREPQLDSRRGRKAEMGAVNRTSHQKMPEKRSKTSVRATHTFGNMSGVEGAVKYGHRRLPCLWGADSRGGRENSGFKTSRDGRIISFIALSPSHCFIWR